MPSQDPVSLPDLGHPVSAVWRRRPIYLVAAWQLRAGGCGGGLRGLGRRPLAVRPLACAKAWIEACLLLISGDDGAEAAGNQTGSDQTRTLWVRASRL